MNILKYVDVLIGLALVMLLLSPLVTGITQILLWLARSRPSALRAGLRDLLLQLSGSPAAAFESATVIAPTLAGHKVQISGFRPATFDPQGRATLDIAPAIVDVEGPLVITTQPDQPMTVIFVRRGPRAVELTSEPTDASGTATLAYTGHAVGYESRRAHVAVLNGTTPVAANVAWTIASGHDAGKTVSLPVTAAQPGAFDYPGLPPSSYGFGLVVTDASGTPLQGHVLKVAFERNADFDPVFPCRTDATGTVSLELTTETDIGLTAESAKEIASAVLLHRMIATPGVKYLTSLGKKYYMGHVVEREEFIRIILELAANEGPAAGLLTPERRETLNDILMRNGVPFPARTLVAIRNRAQELEKEHPGHAAHVRQTEAIIDSAQSDFVGKINNWFDQAMVRVAARYTLWARVVTVAGALVVATVMRVDALELLKRLSADDAFRSSLVTEATNREARIDQLRKELDQGASTETRTPEQNAAGGGAGENKNAASESAGATTTDSEQRQTTRNELADAQAHLAEIQENLAILRAPQLDILPDRFFWQPRPRARVTFFEEMKAPFPAQLELVLGAAVHSVVPRWRGHTVDAIKSAIDRSGARVETAVERDAEALFLKWNGNQPPLATDKGERVDLMRDMNIAARYTVDTVDAPTLTATQLAAAQTWQLIVGRPGSRDAFDIRFTPCRQEDVLTTFVAALEQMAETGVGVEVTRAPLAAESGKARDNNKEPDTLPCVAVPEFPKKVDPATRVDLVAQRPDVDWITVLARPKVDASGVGKMQPFAATSGRILKSDIARFAATPDADLALSGVALCKGEECADVDMDSLARRLNEEAKPPADPASSSVASASSPAIPLAGARVPLEATVQKADALVLTSQRLGTIELRVTPGQAGTNLLGEVEQVDQGWRLPAGQSWRGLILTWILLSLGAPFWYDLFKDLLKLRPALAKSEEQQRTDRQRDTTHAPREAAPRGTPKPATNP